MSETKKNADDGQGRMLKKENYTVEVKYSPEAIDKKLMRFTTPSGDSFEVSAEEMISMLVGQINTETLAPAFVEMEKINVVQVQRQIVATLNRDYKAGETIRFPYIHPYPLEYAILEEAYKIASIEKDRGYTVLTKEFIDEVKAKIQPEMQERMEKFTKSFYKGIKSIDLEKNDAPSPVPGL